MDIHDNFPAQESSPAQILFTSVLYEDHSSEEPMSVATRYFVLSSKEKVKENNSLIFQKADRVEVLTKHPEYPEEEMYVVTTYNSSEFLYTNYQSVDIVTDSESGFSHEMVEDLVLPPKSEFANCFSSNITNGSFRFVLYDKENNIILVLDSGDYSNTSGNLVLTRPLEK